MKKGSLKIERIFKKYGERQIVNGVSFTIEPGEIIGLLGPNGAGKTTTFYMTIGLIRPDSGKVFFNDIDVTLLPMNERAKMGMGYLAQEPSVFRELTVEENILMILETLSLKGQDKMNRLDILLEELHLKRLAKKKAITLSGGERRRLEITRTLVTNPSLLLLDEPFANIDPISVQEVKQLIQLLAKKGISILITDHNAREIFSVVNRSYLIQDGQVTFSGTFEEFINNKNARESYLGNEFRL